jgi:hypothetical protein
MPQKRFWLIAIAAVVLLTTAATVIFNIALGGTRLVVCDRDTNKKYASYAVEQGEEFSISFIHSVNITEVTDVYYVDGNTIVCDKCIYSSFGAGMPTEWEEG